MSQRITRYLPTLKSAQHFALAATAALICVGAFAQSPSPWMQQVSRVVGTPGKVQPDGVLTWNLIRNDLAFELRIQEESRWAEPHRLRPAMASGMLSFQAVSGSEAVATIEFPLREGEVDRFVDVLRAHGVRVTAVHNHYLQDHPKLIFVHADALGNAVNIAHAARDAWQAVGAPVDPEGQPSPDDHVQGLDPEHLAAELGGTGDALDGIADVTVPRNDSVSLKFGGAVVPLQSEMGPQSDLEFQPLGNGRAVVIGEICVTAEESQKVIQVLRASRIEVDALHNHFLTDEPRLFFLHLQARGDADELARVIRRALNETNSKR
jgi:hypothetical protein